MNSLSKLIWKLTYLIILMLHTKHTSTMSPVSETRTYQYQHQDEAENQIQSFRDGQCMIESQKLQNMHTVYHTYTSHPYSHTVEHTLTMSPVSETRTYQYQHQDEAENQIQSFRDKQYMIESQSFEICTLLTIRTRYTLILTHAEHTSTTSPVSETQTYQNQPQDEAENQIQNFRDEQCMIESQKL